MASTHKMEMIQTQDYFHLMGLAHKSDLLYKSHGDH